MVDLLQNELSKRLQNESTAKINWEVTERLSKEPKYVAFNKWCDDNGIRHPSVRYPTAFGKEGHLIGLSSTRRIGFQESYIYVPSKVIICEDQFRNDPKIGHILDNHPEAFQTRISSDHLTVIFFVMTEMIKGEESFWAPYFAITEKTDMCQFWSEDELSNLQDEIMKAEAIDETDVLKDEFLIIFEIAAKYPNAIDISQFTFDVFLQAHTLVCTRCFGYSLPYLMIVPLADCANHHTTDNQYEMFNSRIHRQGKQATTKEEEKFYFTHDKQRINFFKHFSEEGF